MPQTITVTVHAPASGAYNTAFSVAASSSSGLPVVFSSAGSCTNSGGMFTVTSGTGTCQVRYDQPGNSMYAPAPRVVETVTAQKADQTIGFEPFAAKTYGDPDVAVVALATSNLPTTLTASGSCSISGAILHLTGAGSCTVTAAQPGDANYNPAPNRSQSFSIDKADQTITFAALPKKAYGARDFSVDASASSGLPVSFAASGKCTVNESKVHLTGAGSCTITAAQQGDANYNAAPSVSRTFAIAIPACRVPNVRGKSLASAKRALALSHCRTGKVRYGYSAKRKGVVIAQSSSPGRVRPAGSKIDLVVSRGRRP
jgi:hypothetical protein